MNDARNAALDLLAGLVLEDGRRWGDAAADFQREDAENVLDEDSPTPYHFLTRSRGAAKTSDLAAMTVAAMLAQAPAGARLHGVAADRDQARLKVDSIAGYDRRTAELRGALEVQAFKVAAARSGAVLEILAADAESAWGIRPWFLDGNIAVTTQLDVMRIIRASYENGLSIPDTATAIRTGLRHVATLRTRTIARTELASATNAASLAATQIVQSATSTTYFKSWLVAPGAEHPRHETYDGLDGQTVALDAYFTVGDAALMHPADPAGPPDETVNCRCAVSFTEEAPSP